MVPDFFPAVPLLRGLLKIFGMQVRVLTQSSSSCTVVSSYEVLVVVRLGVRVHGRWRFVASRTSRAFAELMEVRFIGVHNVDEMSPYGGSSRRLLREWS